MAPVDGGREAARRAVGELNLDGDVIVIALAATKLPIVGILRDGERINAQRGEGLDADRLMRVVRVFTNEAVFKPDADRRGRMRDPGKCSNARGTSSSAKCPTF